jgi:hypothetical protein
MDTLTKIILDNNFYIMSRFDLNNIINILDPKSLVRSSYLNNHNNLIYICDENNIVAIDPQINKVITESIILDYIDIDDLIIILKKYVGVNAENLKRKRENIEQDNNNRKKLKID